MPTQIDEKKLDALIELMDKFGWPSLRSTRNSVKKAPAQMATDSRPRPRKKVFGPADVNRINREYWEKMR